MTRSIDEQVAYLAKLASAYPIVSIEDGMAEDDWAGWKKLTDASRRESSQLVGDDLFVTNVKRLTRGIEGGIANSLLVKVNRDRHADRDARFGRDRATRRLHHRHLASLRRDRGHDHRRSRRRDQQRPNQDRLARPQRPHRQIQPAHPHRGGAGRRGDLRRAKARSRRWRNAMRDPLPLPGEGGPGRT